MAMNEYEQLIEDEASTRETPGLDTSAKNPYMDLVQEESLDTERAVGIAAQNAVQVQPDRRAEVMKLAERYRLSPETADRQYDALKKLDFAETVKPDRMVKKHPNLAEWLSDPNNMAVSSDELDKLQDLSDTVNDRGDIEKFYNALGVGFARINSSVAKVPALTVDLYNQQFVNPITKALGYGEFAPKEGLRNNAVTDYFDDAAKGYAANVPELDDQVIQTAMAGDYKKASRALAFQVASNFPQLAVTIGSAMMGAPQVGLAMMGGMSAAGEYDEALDNGVNPKSAMANAVVSGSAEAVFEKFGTLGILKKWEATMGKGLSKDSIMKIMRDTGKMLMISGAQEGAEEFGTSVVQDTSKVVTGVNPDLKLENIALNAGNSLLVGMGSGATMTSIGGMAYARQRNAEMNMVNENLMFLDAIGNKVKDLKLRKRLPKAAQQMVEQLTKDGPVENVYIKPEDFKTYFQSKNMDPLEAATLFGVGKEFQEASETGADIRVPLAKFVSNLVETEHYQGLKNSVKFSPDALTYNEAQQEKEKTKADLKLIAKEAEQDEETVPTRIQQAREVKKVIKDRLLEMNNAMIGSNEADQYAVLHAQALSSLAEKSGMSPMDLLNRYGLKIQTQEGVFDVVPSQDVAMASQGQVLNQESKNLTLSPEFQKWFEGSKVVDKSGKPVPVYHGTRSEFGPDFQFDANKIGSSNDSGHYGRGFYFSTSQGEAEYYGPNVGSFFLSLKNPLDLTNNTGSLTQTGHFLDWYPKLKSIGIADKDLDSTFSKLTELREYIQTNATVLVAADNNGNDVGFIAKVKDAPGYSGETYGRRRVRGQGYDTREEALSALFDDMASKISMDLPSLQSFIVREISSRKMTEVASAAGYDGIQFGEEMIVFDPTKIKSTDNRGTFDPTDPRVLFQSAAQAVADQFVEPASPTFSKLIQVVEQKMGGSANPQEIRAMLKEVKEEEKKWLGLEEFLAGKEKVKRQDLLDFLRANEPEIVDVTKGFENTVGLAEAEKMIKENKNVYDAESQRGPLSLEDLEMHVESDRFVVGGEGTKYQQYTLPGGENYREVLFTLKPDAQVPQPSPDEQDLSTWEKSERAAFKQVPKKEVQENPEFVKAKKDLAKKVRAEHPDMKPKPINELIDNVMNSFRPGEGSIQGASPELEAEFIKLHKLYSSLRSPYPKETLYKRDVQGHRFLLVDTNIDGPQRVYFFGKGARRTENVYFDSVEAAMAGLPELVKLENENERKDLYKSSHFDEKNILAHVRLNDRTDADGKKVFFIEEIQSDWHQEGRKKGYRGDVKLLSELPSDSVVEQSDDGKWRVTVGPRQLLSGIDSEQEARERALAKLNREQTQDEPVPDAPFKKTWHEYAFKRIVRMAADGGYDRIAWAPGEPQAERYSLAKKVESIFYYKNLDSNTYYVSVIGKESRRSVWSKDDASESEIEDTIGKELAKRIVETATESEQSISGDGLEVGGDGMKGFYDKILVDYAKKFGKKFGATVGEIRLAEDSEQADEVGQKWPEAAAYAKGEKPVHSLDVTDKMKEVALGQGFELFQSSQDNGKIKYRQDMPDYVPVIEIPDENISIEDAKQFALKNIRKTITRSNNQKIEISAVGIGETAFKTEEALEDVESKITDLSDDEIHATTLAIKHIDRMMKAAVFDKSERVRKGKEGLLDFKRYYVPVSIAGKNYIFRLKTKRSAVQKGQETFYIEVGIEKNGPQRALVGDEKTGRPDPLSPAFSEAEQQSDKSVAGTTLPRLQESFIKIRDFLEEINTARKSRSWFQSDASEADPRARIVISSNKTMRIDLFKKADLSSFLHETGHFYLEIIDDLAKDPRTSQGLKDDYEKIRTWLGAKPGEKLTVDQHEQWARGFELYLASGKAPSTELKRAFAHFKVWLTKIYTNLKNLNVELNDEIIGVMDRLVATDEQLQAALLDQTPLFENPLEMGMSAEQSEKYKKLDNDRKREASEKLTQEAIKSEMQKRQAAYKAARKEVKDRIEKEANEKRVYRALSILQKGKMPDGSPLPEGSQKIKLDRDSIVRVYGKEFLETLPRPFVYTREGGVDFNIAAEMLGYQSGDELLKSIAGMPSKDEYVERETEREMKLRFPDEVMEEFPEQAIRAAHNESRGKMLYFELETLARDNLPLLKDAIKRVARRVPTEKEVRAAARGMIAKKQMSEIRPSVFERAERKAAKEAGEALAKGDIYGAFEAKRKELLNFELYRAAVEAQELNEKAQEFFKKFKQKDEDIAKTRDTDLVNVGRAILAQYGLGRTEKTPEQYLEMMKRYDQENYDSAIALIQNSGLVPGPYKEISFDEFSTMYETVRAIWDLAKSARSVEIDGVRMDKEQMKAELIGKINEMAAPGNRPGYDKAVTDWDKTKMRLLGAKASLRRVESWVSAVDGDSKGIFRKYIWNPISEATAKYRIEKVKVLKQYQDLVQEWAKSSGGFQTPIVAENLGYTFGGKVELLGAILHTGNESNLEKLLVGRGWGQRLDDDTLDTSRWDAFMLKMYRDGIITKADMDFAQKVWDLMETLKPDAQRAHKTMYGFYFNEITANEIQTPFGIYRGGYVPAITDSVMVEDNAINQEKESLKQNNSSMYPTAGRGFTKSRVEQYAAPLAMDLKLVGSHIDKVLRFIHIEPSVKQVARVVMDKEFRANLANLDPVIGQDMLVPWLQRAAQQAVSVPMKGWAGKAIDTFAKELRKRSGLQTMFFNVTNTMQQVTGFTIAAVKVKPKYLRNALWRYIKAPKEFSDAVISKSKFMEGRSATQVMEVNKIIDELAINPTKFEQYRDFVQEHGYFLQSAAQGLVDMTVWTGAYEEAVERGESEKEAVRFADSVVRETQGSMNPEDMSRFESGTALTRLFTMFYSYFNMQANLLGTEGSKTIRDLGLRKGAGRLLYIYTMGFMLPAWFSTLIVQAMGNGIDEDDDEQYLDDLLQSFFTSQFSTATAMFPIVGPIVNRVALSFNDKPYDDRITLSPAISMIESAGGAPLSVYKAIADDGSKKKAVRDVMSAIGLLSGIPTGPIQRPLSYLVDVSEGEADPTGPIDFTRGLVTGKPGQVQ